MSSSLPQGITEGTWTLDPMHSKVSFSARHAGISKVRGDFDEVAGTATIGDSVENSSLSATIKAQSVNTNQDYRDNHLRGEDFFNAEQFPDITFNSTKIEGSEDDYQITGQLTIRGVSHEVVLDTEFNGAAVDQNGQLRAGVSAETTINRRDFGLTFNHVLDNGSMLVGEKIKLSIDAELVAPNQGE